MARVNRGQWLRIADLPADSGMIQCWAIHAKLFDLCVYKFPDSHIEWSIDQRHGDSIVPGQRAKTMELAKKECRTTATKLLVETAQKLGIAVG